ncbi:hypothetical protein [Corynebacterium halotolerans]|uniref:hypothetical protein n=1 Tax=Corynebacterium halotolerans TaxID=225326 RepID=UPI003CF50F47
MTVESWRKTIAAVCVIGLVAVVLLLSQSDRTSRPMAVNGDAVGQETGESLESYVGRAEQSLVEAPAGENAFGMITFAAPLDPESAAEVLSGLERVNAMVLLSASAMPIPEPVAGETRDDVFRRQLDRVDDSLAGIGDITAPRELNGVVAWDDGEAFRSVAADPAVLAVEVLPPDAAWGRFGVRPVDAGES